MATGGALIHVLVLTADADEGTVLRHLLEREGWTAAVTADLAHVPPTAPADLVLLDVPSFGAHALALCGHLSAQGVAVLALVGSATGAAAGALDAGAADCIVRPFSYAELLARVRAVVRRASRPTNLPRLRVGELELCPARFEARYRGRPVRLSRTEFRMLHFLAMRAGQVVPTDELVRAIWGPGESNLALVRVNLYRLRQKLEADPRRPQLLRALPGPGVMLDVPRAAD